MGSRGGMELRGGMFSRGGMTSRGSTPSSGLLDGFNDGAPEVGSGGGGGGRPGGASKRRNSKKSRRHSLIEVIEDSGGRLVEGALLPPIDRPKPKPLSLNTSPSRGAAAILPTGWDTSGQKKVDSRAALEDAANKEEWARRRQARKAYALWESQKKAEAETDYKKRMQHMQKMHEDDPDWDQEAAAAEIQEGAEAAGMAAIAEMTGIGGAMDLSVANGSKSMAFMGFFSQAVSKFKEGGKRRSHREWLEAKQAQEAEELSQLWAQAEAEIEAEDNDEFAAANTHERFVQERLAHMRVERQNLTARVLNESSQIVGGFSRPSSAVQPANHVEEVIRPTEDQQYELGVEVLAVLDKLDMIAPGAHDGGRTRHRLVGVPTTLPPKPTREMVGKKPRY